MVRDQTTMVDNIVASVLESHDPCAARVGPTERRQFSKGFIDAFSLGLIGSRHESGVIPAEKNDASVIHIRKSRVRSFQIGVSVARVHPVWNGSTLDQIWNCKSSNAETRTSGSVDWTQFKRDEI